MPSLPETLDRFTRAIFSGDASGMHGLLQGGALTPDERLDIYRNNVLVNYRNALRDTYPALVRLVGDEFFNAAARRYARAHRSTSGDLHDYGDTFAEFLQDFEPARTLPYLPDVARLEWAMHRVFHAADADALAPADFSVIDETRMPMLRLALHPATWLMTSDYPVREIWRLSQGAAADEAQVDLEQGGQWLLVVRRQFEVHIDALAPGEHALLRTLADGGTLAQAVDHAVDLDPAFDLGAVLMRHVTGGTFSTLSFSQADSA